jgi:small subunit ribosomal protein S17
MADEDQTNETEETPVQEPAGEAPVEEPAAEEPAGQTPAEADAEQADDAPPEPKPEPAEPVAVLTPKERRQRRRVERAPAKRDPRSPEERHAERLAERRRKAAARRSRRVRERAKAAERRASAPAPEPLAPVHPPNEGAKRVRQGIVVSDKAEKTITVRIDVARRHRRYEKIVRSSSTVHAHDENNDAHEGDIVRVIESRPLSRTKRWTLMDVLERAR